MSAALELQNVTKVHTVPGRTDVRITALAGISLTMPEGSFTAVVGPSGCGKSTLLHCSAGLDKPTSGNIKLLGTDISALRPGQRSAFRAHHVGFVFQDYNLISSLSAADNVALTKQLRGQPCLPSEVSEALKRVGIEDRAGLRPHQLSGGERQRVAIARVLASRPPIIFADEPTGALDQSAGEAVLDWLQLLASQGSTVVMVTHDINAAARADRVLVMQAGQVVADLPHASAETVVETLQQNRNRRVME